MEFKHTLEVLHAQAEEIRNMAEKLKLEGDIRRIDLDLLLEKLRNVYDLASDLQAISKVQNKTDSSAADHPGPSKETEEIVSSEPEFTVDTAAEEEQASFGVPEEVSTPEIEPEAFQTPGVELTEEEVPVQAGNKKETQSPEAKMVSDRFTSNRPSLNEELSVKAKKEDVSSQYKSSPISSIRSAIGINERFELINELFDGDKERFDKTIEALNSADTFVQAYKYLEENFNWDMDSTHVQRILELIRRKLIVRRNEQ